MSAITALLLIGGTRIGVIGWHYPYVIEDEPLRNPQKVIRVDDFCIYMANGAVIRVAGGALDNSNMLSQSRFEADVIPWANDFISDERKFYKSLGLSLRPRQPVEIWARQDGKICRTPWAQPIRIPLIRDTVYKNRRQLVSVGEQYDGQPAD